ncbi:MAG TPA: hypothetical protein VE174_03670 [Actinomycetota bacterium]|nr:hypothetical protein [Actinomycetota bacterium]
MERRGDEPDRQPQDETQPTEAPVDGPDAADSGDSSQDEPTSS